MGGLSPPYFQANETTGPGPPNFVGSRVVGSGHPFCGRIRANRHFFEHFEPKKMDFRVFFAVSDSF